MRRAAARTGLLLALLLALAACAAPGPPLPKEPPLPYPAELRERLVALAEREWRAFGQGVTDQTGPERVELKPALPQEDPQVFHLVQGYWNAVREERPEWDDYVREQRALRRRGSDRNWQPVPWSAAFISYLMRSAGVDRADFPWTAAHSTYLDYAILSDRRWGRAALYAPLDLEDHAPRPGDLVCADRTRPPTRRLTSVAARMEELGVFRAMHCDLVVERRPGRLDLIGGNLSNSVRMVYLPLDSQGYVRRPPAESTSAPAAFAVLRLNVPEPIERPLLSDAAK